MSSSLTPEQMIQRCFALMLYRSLQRLHIAIKDCEKIGFEESSPTRNPHHYEVWTALNDAQVDAALKLKAYEDHSNAVLAETLADWKRLPVRGGDILRPSEHKPWRLETDIRRGRPYDGAIIDKKGRLIIPRTYHD